MCGDGKFMQYRVCKMTNWFAAAVFFTSDQIAQRSLLIAESFRRENATGIVALSIPFYWEDGSLHGYIGSVDDAVVEEIAEEWSPYDHVIAGESGDGELTACILYCPDDFALFLGSSAFLERSLGDVGAQARELVDFATAEQRNDLLCVASEAAKYEALDEGCTIAFPIF